MDSSEQEEIVIRCEVCDLPFTSIKPFEQHMKGKKHKKQIEDKKRQSQDKSHDGDLCAEETKDSEIQGYTCVICETTFSGIIPYHQHQKSKSHFKALRRKQAEEDLAELEEVGSDSELPDNDDADLTEILKKILAETYGSCSICEKQFCGPESYSQHLKSKSHAKRKSELQLLKKIKAILSPSKLGDSEGHTEDLKEGKGFIAAEGQEELLCKDCNKVFTGSVPFAQHVTSKAHKKREGQNKLLKDLKAIKMMELEDDSSSSTDYEESTDVLNCQVCSISFCGPENLKAHIQSKKHQKAMKLKKYLAKKGKSVEGSSQTSFKDKSDSEAFSEEENDPPAKLESAEEVVKGNEPLPAKV